MSFLFKSVGPKLVMIQLMVRGGHTETNYSLTPICPFLFKMRDLLFFLSIMVIFIFAYGITTHATLHPGAKLEPQLLRHILNKAYWPIYGDLRLLSEITSDTCSNSNRTDCPEQTGTIFTYVVMMVYMIIANVLLVNLLIAMFR